MRLDVFTQIPHAFGWLTEQRPLATVLGDELELRLFNYRDTTPLRSGQVDDDPYGGGAGMVLRVDVVASALETVYGADPPARIVALTPQGRQPARLVVDAIARRLPGALAEGSGESESFSAELEGGIEYPHFTRPAEFRGWTVPEVLLSGDHARIDEWRHDQSRARTARLTH